MALSRSLELELKVIKYTSALGGGVLFKGSSSKDIDIFIAPYNKTDTNYDLVINLFIKMGFIRKKQKKKFIKVLIMEIAPMFNTNISKFGN